jgi:hypothetical protein
MKKTAKIESTNIPEISRVKRYDRYLANKEVKARFRDFQYWAMFRKPAIAKGKIDFVFGGILDDVYKGLRRDEHLLKQYNIKSIGFGTWVKNEDRINFLAALSIAFYDLKQVCGSMNLGKGKLQLDWGGVGRKGASGIFFRKDNLISMPRYKRPDKYLAELEKWGGRTSYLKEQYFNSVYTVKGTVYTLNPKGKAWIMQTAGWGSFAHEFGHFIDFRLGQSFDKSGTDKYASGKNALPQFKSNLFLTSNLDRKKRTAAVDEYYISEIITGRNEPYERLNYIEKAFFDWLVAMYFVKQPNKEYRPNGQYRRLVKFCEDREASWKYWGSLVELWARSFEVYVNEFLERKGIYNRFLVSANAKFGRDIRYLDGGKVEVVDAHSAYVTSAHVWQNKRVFEKIIDIFVKL